MKRIKVFRSAEPLSSWIHQWQPDELRFLKDRIRWIYIYVASEVSKLICESSWRDKFTMTNSFLKLFLSLLFVSFNIFPFSFLVHHQKIFKLSLCFLRPVKIFGSYIFSSLQFFSPSSSFFLSLMPFGQIKCAFVLFSFFFFPYLALFSSWKSKWVETLGLCLRRGRINQKMCYIKKMVCLRARLVDGQKIFNIINCLFVRCECHKEDFLCYFCMPHTHLQAKQRAMCRLRVATKLGCCWLRFKIFFVLSFWISYLYESHWREKWSESWKKKTKS